MGISVLNAFTDVLARSQPAFIALALLVFAASVPLVAWRWQIVLAAVTGRRAPLGTLVLASLASSFVNNVTPSARLGGEACRVAALVSLKLASVGRAAAAAAYERLSEAPAIVAIALATLLVVGRLPVGAPGWVWLSAGACAAAVVVAARRPLVRALGRARAHWASMRAIAIAPSALLWSGAISGLVWLLDVIRLRFAAAAFHAPIGLTQAAALTAITIVAGLVPTVGGLGVIEGGLVAGLIGMGVAPADAVGITAVERGISYGVSTLAGFGALSMLGGRTLWNAVRVSRPAVEAVT